MKKGICWLVARLKGVCMLGLIQNSDVLLYGRIDILDHLVLNGYRLASIHTQLPWVVDTASCVSERVTRTLLLEMTLLPSLSVGARWGWVVGDAKFILG